MGIEEIRRLKEQSKMPKIKEPYRIPKVSKKKAAQMKEDEADRKVSGGGELQRWFNDRRKEMSGRCQHCGGKSSKNSDYYFRHSIAHLLPKRLFKSVATHPENWLELCYHPPSCHANFDNHKLEWTELNCFAEAIRKFVAIYPSIAKDERKYIPDVLLQYIEVEK